MRNLWQYFPAFILVLLVNIKDRQREIIFLKISFWHQLNRDHRTRGLLVKSQRISHFGVDSLFAEIHSALTPYKLMLIRIN